MPKAATHPRFSVIDVETTGLFPWRHDRIIEIAVVVMSPKGAVECEYETLINPERDIGPSRIHGITAGEVLRAPRFVDIAGDCTSDEWISRSGITGLLNGRVARCLAGTAIAGG